MFKRAVKFLGIRLSFIILVVILLVVSAILGLMLGYGVLGGGNPSHVFDHNLWTEVLNKLNPSK